jgi:hypothetical protein
VTGKTEIVTISPTAYRDQLDHFRPAYAINEVRPQNMARHLD